MKLTSNKVISIFDHAKKSLDPVAVVSALHAVRKLSKEISGMESDVKGLVKKLELEGGLYGDVLLERKTVEPLKPSVDYDTLMEVLTKAQVKKLEAAGAFKTRGAYETLSTREVKIQK